LQASLLAARDWQFCKLKGSASKAAPEKAAASCPSLAGQLAGRPGLAILQIERKREQARAGKSGSKLPHSKEVFSLNYPSAGIILFWTMTLKGFH
jgi:hypothetical protein